MESVAKLKNSPHPARKMRLLADLIRGEEVDRALSILRFHPKKLYSRRIEKLLLSAVANWREKYGESALEEAGLFVKTVMVDNGRQLKRIQPRAQGRAYLIRKRSSHITLILENSNDVSHLLDQHDEDAEEVETEQETDTNQENDLK